MKTVQFQGGTAISYTQKEYLYALERNIPTIAFVHSNPGKLPADRTELESDNRRKLGSFVELVQQRLCKSWTSSHELGAVVSRSITQLIKRNPRIGWIRADQATNSDAAQEIVLLSKRIRELEDQISRGTINTPIQDSSDLSQGNDPISIVFNINIENTSLNFGNPERQKKEIVTISTTWIELFKYLSPHLHSGIPEGTLKNVFGRFAELRLPDAVRQRSDKYTFSSARITSESFNVIKVQFTALGMIETFMLETERKSVLAWRLSRQGVDYMYNTIAIRKPDIHV